MTSSRVLLCLACTLENGRQALCRRGCNRRSSPIARAQCTSGIIVIFWLELDVLIDVLVFRSMRERQGIVKGRLWALKTMLHAGMPACLIVSVNTLSTRTQARTHTAKYATSTGESEVPSFIRGWKQSTSTAGDETTALGAVPLSPTAMALTTVPDLSTSTPSLHRGDAGVGSAQFAAHCYRSIVCGLGPSSQHAATTAAQVRAIRHLFHPWCSAHLQSPKA